MATLAMVVLAIGGLAVAPADADDTIRTQWYTAPTGLDELKARGLDGTGVTIAIIDGPIDTSVPELVGADITVNDPCGAPTAPAEAAHATRVASILASPDFGWAPKAKYLNYVLPLSDDVPEACQTGFVNSTGSLINQAVRDGADIISIQVVDDPAPGDPFAISNAALHKVPVVIAAGSDSEVEWRMSVLNYTVGVSSGNDGQHLASTTTYGRLLAPGVDIMGRRPDESGALTLVDAAQGTSFAAPMVTGAIALAMQQHPDADPDQLLHALAATAARYGDEWNEMIGWGRLDAVALVNADPRTFPTGNPFADKNPGGEPSPEQVADYRDGLVDPTWLYGDNDYVYRGEDTILCKFALIANWVLRLGTPHSVLIPRCLLLRSHPLQTRAGVGCRRARCGTGHWPGGCGDRWAGRLLGDSAQAFQRGRDEPRLTATRIAEGQLRD